MGPMLHERGEQKQQEQEQHYKNQQQQLDQESKELEKEPEKLKNHGQKKIDNVIEWSASISNNNNNINSWHNVVAKSVVQRSSSNNNGMLLKNCSEVDAATEGTETKAPTTTTKATDFLNAKATSNILHTNVASRSKILLQHDLIPNEYQYRTLSADTMALEMLATHNNSGGGSTNNNNGDVCSNSNNNNKSSNNIVRHLQQHNMEMTIDFNSRRRRGRLRRDRAESATLLTGSATLATTATTTTTTPTRTTALPSIKPKGKEDEPEQQEEEEPPLPTKSTAATTSPSLATFFTLLLLLVSSYKQRIAKALQQSYRRHRRSLLNYVYKTIVNTKETTRPQLVLSSSATSAVAASETAEEATATTATAAATKAVTTIVGMASTIVDRVSKIVGMASTIVGIAVTTKETLAISAVTASTKAFNLATPSVISNNRMKAEKYCHITAANVAVSSCKRIIYAFLLLTTILPCNHIQLASAAKPKSATQLQQHTHQQQQQQHQHELELEQQQQHDLMQLENGIRTPPSYHAVSSQTSNEDSEFLSEEQLFGQQNMFDDENAAYEVPPTNATFDNSTKTPLFPKDLFTKEQLENGAVVCHIIGVIYMFVALAIVCDEFFVPSLDVIIEKLGITDDVAGATFMAAGGSAPELFTSVIGVFVSFDDVGIGTIVGSAVFNILFVIGMCALFSKTVLTLTWWPLFRDCTFYSISLIVLIYFFRDNRIYWWEALILFSIYIAYVTFMKWNVQVERCVKKLITKNKVTRVRSTDQLMPAGNAANSSETSMATQPGGSVTSRAASETRSGPPGAGGGGGGGSSSGATGNSSGGTAGSTQTGAKFRHGLLQLMIHTIDPLHDGKVDEKATQLHAIASLKVLLDATKPQRGGATTSAANHVKINLKETTLADRPNGNIDTTLDSPSLSGRRPSWIEQRVKIQTRKFSIKANEIEDEPEPLSMAWPDTARKRLTYIVVAPLLIPMWLTLPDTRTPRGKKYFPVTFIGSILWIAAFSYLMVWWANVAGDTARIPPEVMGLTFLAAGTSIPDLITSVIVARKGFGDMAVSSSVGSNIFDVTVGLPIPWLLYGIIYKAPVEVNSCGMVCSITILFMMLIFVVMSIACFRWRMNKGLGFTMFLLYFVFVAVSLLFEYDVINCPV